MLPYVKDFMNLKRQAVYCGVSVQQGLTVVQSFRNEVTFGICHRAKVRTVWFKLEEGKRNNGSFLTYHKPKLRHTAPKPHRINLCSIFRRDGNVLEDMCLFQWKSTIGLQSKTHLRSFDNFQQVAIHMQKGLSSCETYPDTCMRGTFPYKTLNVFFDLVGGHTLCNSCICIAKGTLQVTSLEPYKNAR
jgi:hypothetical protein